MIFHKIPYCPKIYVPLSSNLSYQIGFCSATYWNRLENGLSDHTLSSAPSPSAIHRSYLGRWPAFLPNWSRTSCILKTNWFTFPSISLFADVPSTLGILVRWLDPSPMAILLSRQGHYLKAAVCQFAIASAINTWGHQWPLKRSWCILTTRRMEERDHQLH